jgi:hypothetical protein
MQLHIRTSAVDCGSADKESCGTAIPDIKIRLLHFHNSQLDAESDPLESGIICLSVARAGPENNIRDSAPDQNNVKIIFYPCTS